MRLMRTHPLMCGIEVFFMLTLTPIFGASLMLRLWAAAPEGLVEMCEAFPHPEGANLIDVAYPGGGGGGLLSPAGTRRAESRERRAKSRAEHSRKQITRRGKPPLRRTCVCMSVRVCVCVCAALVYHKPQEEAEAKAEVETTPPALRILSLVERHER